MVKNTSQEGKQYDIIANLFQPKKTQGSNGSCVPQHMAKKDGCGYRTAAVFSSSLSFLSFSKKNLSYTLLSISCSTQQRGTMHALQTSCPSVLIFLFFFSPGCRSWYSNVESTSLNRHLKELANSLAGICKMIYFNSISGKNSTVHS